MSVPTTRDRALPPWAAATVASCAFTIPLALSASSSPSPNHPRVMAWYLSLRQPRFKPPDWVIPVAWAGIEAALATAAYRLLRAAGSAQRSKALALLGWNVLMIGGWNRLFFRHRSLGSSTIAAAALLGTSVAYVNAAKPVDRTASRAGLPLVGWVAFATVLTATIFSLNSRSRSAAAA